MLDDLRTATQRIADITRTSWSMDTADRVIIGRPQEETSLPYATVQVVATAREFTGTRFVTESQTWVISGVFVLERGDVAMWDKIEKAQALGEALVDALWSDIGFYMPTVSQMEYADEDFDKDEVAVSVTFSLMTDVDQ